ncbi:hypothetical protein ACEWY4_006356 [Coilia grayii]|uniref:B30.2/SPRY domain-containing protein n=1 Tax=Coilia grayii TaxID=363190 RepID=A0ABD1KDF5_9TELE
MSGTRVLILALLLSPCLLHSTNSRRVASSSGDDPPESIRTVRSLSDFLDKHREMIANIKTQGGIDNTTEVETTFIMACLGMDEKAKSMEITINDLRNTISDMNKNFSDVRKAWRVQLEKLQPEELAILRVMKMQRKINGWINEMDAKTIAVAQLTLRALQEYIKVENLEAKITKARGLERTELREQLKVAKEKLRLAEQELIAASGTSNLIMQIVKLQDRIRELESREPDDDLLKEIDELRQQLEGLLIKLPSDQSATVVTQIITLQDQILQIYQRLQTLKQQFENNIDDLKAQLTQKNGELERLRQSSDASASAKIIVIEKEVSAIEGKIEAQKRKIAAQIEELEKTIKNNKNSLVEKVRELEETSNADYSLIVKIITQQIKVSEIERTECSAQKDTVALLIELEAKLVDRETDINNLKEKNKRLQQQLQHMSHECSGLVDKITELEGSLEKEIQKVKGDLKPLLELVSLKFSIQQIKMSIASEKSAVKIIELKWNLKEKEDKMKEKVEEIKNSGLEGSQEAVKIVSLLMDIWELQTGVESEATLKLIYDLQNELNRLIDSLKDTTSSKQLLTILAAQTDQARIKRLKIVISEKYQVELTELHTKLEKAEQELEVKTSEVAGKDKDISNLGKQIKALQVQIEKLRADIQKLNETTSNHIEDLDRQLKISQKMLENKSKALQLADKNNGELLIRITTLVEKIKDTETKAYEKDQFLTSKITTLEKQLENLRKENVAIKEKNKALEKENEECSGLQQRYDDLKKKTDALMSKVTDSYKYILQINDLSIEIENLQKTIVRKPDNVEDLKKLLEVKLKELENLKNETRNVPGSREVIKIVEVITTMNKEMHKATDKHLKHISDLQEQVDKLIEQLKGKTTENEVLVVQIMAQKATETRLTKEIAILKQKHAAEVKVYQDTLDKKQKELELETSRCNKQADRIEELKLVISESQANLSNYTKIYGLKITELEQNLKKVTQQLQDAIAQLKIVEGDKAEQVLKIIQIQTEMTSIVNKAVTEKQALHAEITALKKHINTCSEEKAKLTDSITELKINEKKIVEKCSLINETYWEMKTEFDVTITKVDKNSQLILKMNMLLLEIEALQRKMVEETGDLTELENEVQKKTEELEKLEKQLGLNNRINSKKITNIITTIINNERTAIAQNNEQYLAQIDDLNNELDEKLAMLKGEEAEKTKLLIKILTLENDVSSLENRISKTKEESSKKIAEIERQLREKMIEINVLKVKNCGTQTMNKKIAELEAEANQLELDLSKAKQTANDQLKELGRRLAEKKKQLQSNSDKMVALDKQNGELVLKLAAMENKMNTVIFGAKDLEEISAAKIKELKNELDAKVAELKVKEGEKNKAMIQVAEHQDEITQLKDRLSKARAAAEQKITDLVKSKQEVIDSCTTFKEQYADMKKQVEEDMKKIEDIPGLILRITNLNREIEALKKAITHKTGDETELKTELEKKMAELAMVEKALGGKTPAAKQIKEIIVLLREKDKVNIENSQEYLKRITELEDELDEKIALLKDEEGEKVKAIIKVMEHQDEITQLKDRLSKARAAAKQKITAIETELDNKRREIDRLKVQDCGKGQKKQAIEALEKEATDLQVKLNNLKDSSKKEIDDLMNRLKLKEKEIQDSSEKLRTLDKEHGALILKNIDIQNKMAALLNSEKDIKQKAADEIADLKKEIAKLKAENDELRGSVGQAKDCAHLKGLNEELRNHLEKKDQTITTVQAEKAEALEKLKEREAELTAEQEKTSGLEKEKKQLEESLREKEEENEKQKRKLEEFEKDSAAKKEKAVHVSQPAIDPDTAHPKLQLSNNNREMRLLVNPQRVSDLPQRFNHFTAALASTGFNEGRQYWEVGVTGKPCYSLGVASEQARKKGSLILNPRNKFWTLTLRRSDHLIADDKQKIRLRGEGVAKPTKIGVLIDFKIKEISFYDAGSRTHMYSFRDVDTNAKLFPFMSTCEDTEEGSPPMVFNAVASAQWLES